MDTYGHGLGRLAYPLARACLAQTSIHFLLRDRAILQAIYLKSVKSIGRTKFCNQSYRIIPAAMARAIRSR
jgi:hypothetical protein